MNLTHIVETAAFVSAWGEDVVLNPLKLRAGGLGRYHAHSRDRLQLWLEELGVLESRVQAGRLDAADPLWQRGRGVLAEVMISEVLTRVWTVVVCAAEERYGNLHLDSVAWNVFSGHSSARLKVLRLLVDLDGRSNVPARDVEWLDRIRRRAERWTDLLLGRYVVEGNAEDLAFDADRARHFGREQLERCDPARGRSTDGCVLALVQTGLRVSFPAAVMPEPVYTTHHRRICRAVLSAFPAHRLTNELLFQSAIDACDLTVAEVGLSGTGAHNLVPGVSL